MMMMMMMIIIMMTMIDQYMVNSRLLSRALFQMSFI